jgi:hypothetical protein
VIEAKLLHQLRHGGVVPVWNLPALGVFGFTPCFQISERFWAGFKKVIAILVPNLFRFGPGVHFVLFLNESTSNLAKWK